MILSLLLGGALPGCSSDSGGGTDTAAVGAGDTAVVGDTAVADLAVDTAAQSDVPADAPEDAVPGDLATAEGALTARSSALTRTACTAPQTTLVINELMIDPNATSNEWIEIYNQGAVELDLLNYRIKTNDFERIIDVSTKVPAGGWAVLCRGTSQDTVTCAYTYGGGINLYDAGTWTVSLLEPLPSTNVVDTVTYTDAPAGQSLALKNPYLDNGDPANFAPSTAAFGVSDKGTPGAKNSDVWVDVNAPGCDDGKLCTVDTCDKGVCKSDWIDQCCQAASDCVDQYHCTIDTNACDVPNHKCIASGLRPKTPNCCENVTLPDPLNLLSANAQCNGSDENPCNTDYCLPDAGQPAMVVGTASYGTCQHSAHNTTPNCCWAPSAMAPGDRVAYANSQCADFDKNPCTPNDTCDLATNRCAQGPFTDGCCLYDSMCNKGQLCTIYTCQNNTCHETPKAGCCVVDADCHEKPIDNPCTTDVCDDQHHCMSIVVLGVNGGKDCCISDDWCKTKYPPEANIPCQKSTCEVDPTSGFTQCVHSTPPTCTLKVPYVEPFTGSAEVSGKQAWTTDPAPAAGTTATTYPDTNNLLQLLGWKILDQSEPPTSPTGQVLSLPPQRLNWTFTDSSQVPLVDPNQPFDLLTNPQDVGSADYMTLGQYTRSNVPGAVISNFFMAFRTTPLQYRLRSVAYSPTLDASSCPADGFNPLQRTSIQWRQAYRHAIPGRPVTVRAVVSVDDFASMAPVYRPGTTDPWQVTTDTDLEYSIESGEIPATMPGNPGVPLWNSTSLRVGFMMDTTPGGTAVDDAGTFNLNSWQVDDVTVACGVPNQFVKAVVYDCDPAASTCNSHANMGKDYEIAAGEVLPTIHVEMNSWFYVVLCFDDKDAGPTVWNFWGNPTAYLDQHLDQMDFVASRGCDRDGQDVADTCGAGFTHGFFCSFDVKPIGSEKEVGGQYHVGLVARDEGLTKPHEPFESLTKFNVDVLLDGGWVIWSPNGRDDDAAKAIYDAIWAAPQGRAMIVTDLSSIKNHVNQYQGIFAVLGTGGKYHPLSANPADPDVALLRDYIVSGGRVYLEGGDFFYTGTGAPQAKTVLHDYFNIHAKTSGALKMTGPIIGRNFLEGGQYTLSNDGQFNSWNDQIEHEAGSSSRDILRVEPASYTKKPYSVAVANEGGVGAHAYRVIGSSLPFAGMGQMVNGTWQPYNSLMNEYLYFLLHGFPPCTTNEMCNDQEVCTDDVCNLGTGKCTNLDVASCIPCLNDIWQADDGTGVAKYSCGQDPMNDQACVVKAGRCEDIGWCASATGSGGALPCTKIYDKFTTDCYGSFGKAPTTRSCVLNVSQPGLIQDLQVKVQVTHTYRGDVKMTLTAPSGDQVTLLPGHSSDPNKNIYETYEFGVPIAKEHPADPAVLSVFNGKPLSGAWTLAVEDTTPGVNNGTLDKWALYAKYEPQGCTADDQCVAPMCYDSATCNLGAHPPQCEYVAKNCDDGKVATFDSCDPSTGECVHTPGKSCPGCPCTQHYPDCGDDGACLGTNGVHACQTGEVGCSCIVLESDVAAEKHMPLGIPITDAVAAGSGGYTLVPLLSTLTLTPPASQATNVVRKVWVKVQTDHPAIGDLLVDLCHLGTCVPLHSQTGGGTAGFYRIYDYDAPFGTLDDLKGLVAAGDWTLRVTDNSPGDHGTLKWWKIYVNLTDCYHDSDCDDVAPCTVDRCAQGVDGGTCLHEDLQCPPLVGAPACQVNQCTPSDGICRPVTANDGASCEDGKFCTVGDTCQGGACTAGGARNCSFLDGQCVVGVCDEIKGNCRQDLRSNGTPCSDGNQCTTGDICVTDAPTHTSQCTGQAAGVCMCTKDLDCNSDNTTCNGTMFCDIPTHTCQILAGPKICGSGSSTCRPSKCVGTGTCVDANAPNGLGCDDGQFCTDNDVCTDGVCVGPHLHDCSSADTLCTTNTCDFGLGACRTDNKAEDTPCEIGYDPIKDPQGGCSIEHCVAGDCVHKDDVHCSEVVCQGAACQPFGFTGYQCIYTNNTDGQSCPGDGDQCTADTCLSGDCIHTKMQHCPIPCSGSHEYDAGDQICGYDDSCVGGTRGLVNGNPAGLCTPVCTGSDCVKAESGSVNLPISDKLGVVVSQISAATPFRFIESADVKIRVTHDSLADLDIDLVDPQNYVHKLWNHIGGARRNFADTFDLSIPVPFLNLQVPGAQPILDANVPMCALGGEIPTGQWRLRIQDTFDNGKGGSLREWSLFLHGTNRGYGVGKAAACVLDSDCTAGDICIRPDQTPCLGAAACTCRTSTKPNAGHRCEDAIDLGDIDINPSINVVGTTECGLPGVTPTGCGGNNTPQRLYKYTLHNASRVTITLPQPDRDLILFLKKEVNGTCDQQVGSGHGVCSQVAGAGAVPEVLDDQFQPGVYYLGVGTQGTPFDYGPFEFNLRLKTLVPDGGMCRDPVADQYKDCISTHCQNGFCCGSDETNPAIKAQLDCCPAGAFDVPADGDDPYKFCTLTAAACTPTHGNADCPQGQACHPYRHKCMTCAGDWARTNVTGATPAIDESCPAQYRVSSVCDGSTAEGALPGNPSNAQQNQCQGHRFDARCENHVCVKKFVDDDSGCGDTLKSDECTYYLPQYCGTLGTPTCPTCWPGAQTKPTCPTFCTSNADCDSPVGVYPHLTRMGAHCDPDSQPPLITDVGALAGDPHALICTPDLPDGAECNENTDCQSAHCQNGFCCASGDCCPTDNGLGADLCVRVKDGNGVSLYKQDPSCAQSDSCDGSRVDPTCINKICGSVTVNDDCACGRDHAQSGNCGLYREIWCPEAPFSADAPAYGSDVVLGTSCPATALWNGVAATPVDWSSDWNTHKPTCRANCRKSCVHDSTCTGTPGITGDTCRTNDGAGVCTTTLSCSAAHQKWWGNQDCPANVPCLSASTGVQCGTGDVDCRCTTCLCAETEDDTLCDDIAHCDPFPDPLVPTNEKQCSADIPNGQSCNENTDCANKATIKDGLGNALGHCQNNYCCEGLADDCCDIAQHCPGYADDKTARDTPLSTQAPTPSYWYKPVCTDQVLCEGYRVDGVCDPVTFGCGNTNVHDDSGCLASMVSSTCGAYTSITCDGHDIQDPGPSCPVTCRKDCINTSHCVVDYVQGGQCQNAAGGACVPGSHTCHVDNDCHLLNPDGLTEDYSAVCLNATTGAKCDGGSGCLCTSCKCQTAATFGSAAQDNVKCDSTARCDPVWLYSGPEPVTPVTCRDKMDNVNDLDPTSQPEQCDGGDDCVSGYCQIKYCCNTGGCCRGCRVDPRENSNGFIPSFGSGGTGYRDPTSPNAHVAGDDILPTITDLVKKGPTDPGTAKPVFVQSQFGQSTPIMGVTPAQAPSVNNRARWGVEGSMQGTTVDQSKILGNEGNVNPATAP